MADSKRKQILMKMEVALSEIDAFTKVVYGMPAVKDMNLLAIVPTLDDFERSSKLTNRNGFSFSLRVILPEMFQQALYEYEDRAPLVKAVMDANRFWDGLAYDTILLNEKWLWPDAEWKDTGVDMNYIIQYAP